MVKSKEYLNTYSIKQTETLLAYKKLLKKVIEKSTIRKWIIQGESDIFKNLCRRPNSLYLG